ncbi:MAG: hypothetical protein J6A17_04240 [Bacilli bacterium]|nr:hypothetical protein [Bacilli bacterium]
MREENLLLIQKLINEDALKGDMKDLRFLKSYLEGVIEDNEKFDNPELKEKLDALLIPLREFGVDRSIYYFLNNKRIKDGEEYRDIYLFEFASLTSEELAKIRGVGPKKLELYQRRLDGLGLNLGMDISKDDKLRILGHMQTKTKVYTKKDC